MTRIFVDTLKDPFFDRLVSSAASDFAHLVTIGDRIEKGLRDGKILGEVTTPSAPKKYSGGFPKKREGETNAISRNYKGKQQASYGQVATVVPIPYQQPMQQQQMYQPQHQQHHHQQNTAPPRQFKPRPPRRKLDPLPVPYSQIFPYLQKEGLLTLRELKPVVFPYPPGYDANAHCEFHMGAPGHTLENCFAFQNRVQDLIEAKAVSFTPRRSNVNTNPRPTHKDASVSAIEESDQGKLICKVEEIQTPITMIGAQLLKSGLIPEELINCHVKSKRQEEIVVMDIPYDEVKVEIPISPLVIEFSTPFEYKDEKAVPWIYQPKAFKQGQEDQPLMINEPNVTSIMGPTGMTRSGRMFTPRTADTSERAKGKEVVVQIPIPNQGMQDMHLSPKAVVTREEAEQLLTECHVEDNFDKAANGRDKYET
ncbi:uncharacterized protein LOC127094357 [Lathyrus oleraceus]|uniref:uncharacterized protein LOC127094357 n=1 Tax=Pisum sativum TaxID=3888 RepID=UPI0021D27B82|nr:uncharacterized protein LOC127094357 [Pisum sativum]